MDNSYTQKISDLLKILNYIQTPPIDQILEARKLFFSLPRGAITTRHFGRQL